MRTLVFTVNEVGAMGDSEQGRNKGATGRGESERRPGRLGNVKPPLSWRRLSARSGVQCQMHPF